MKTTNNINTNFIKEWQPFDKLNKNVKRAILSHFMKNEYKYQPTHEKSSIKPFKPVTFSQIDNFLGLAYTSTGDYAGLWVCNISLYLDVKQIYKFEGFALGSSGFVYAICWDENENEILIPIN